MKTGKILLVFPVITVLATSPAMAQNLLTDGDFSLTTVVEPFYTEAPPPGVWSSWMEWGVSASFDIADGVCTCNIPAEGFPGSYNYSIQLAQGGFQLEQGHSYRLSFDVKADADRTFGVFLGEVGGNWTSLTGWERYTQNATTQWQTITLDFNTPCVFAYYKLSFEMGMINISTSFDNVSLTDLGPYTPSIGIIGTSVNGWDTDVNMESVDGTNYSIQHYLTAGRIKFRQDDSWCVNWGADGFPEGTGYGFGPDIPVSNPGLYNIAFNRETGQYKFECVSQCSPFVGISGTAVPPAYGWENDLNLTTTDGVNYFMTAVLFTAGEAKFRQDDSWAVNWGGSTFPAGNAVADGPPIPVPAGAYSVAFNIVSGDYIFTFPSIGIIGDALPGWWWEDIDLQTSDGILYTISNLELMQGEVKFRQDNGWDVNWGNTDFPVGYGYAFGPNIPVLAGTYNVTFDRITGIYTFTAVNCPVAAIRCSENIYTSTDPGVCGAYVWYPEVIPQFNCGGEGVTVEQLSGLASGELFPPGVTTNSFVLTNAAGETAQCSFDVYVWDGEPPMVTGLDTVTAPIWPPDHRMVTVPLDYTVTDQCGSTSCEIYIWSNEPENGTGDGDTSPDWAVSDDHTVSLRAERSATGDGREYHVILMCHDDSWNYTFNEIVYRVPHDMNPASAVWSSIWPNPSDYEFNVWVESASSKPIRISVTDANGRQVFSCLASSGQVITFGANLKPGIYNITIRQEGESDTFTVIKY